MFHANITCIQCNESFSYESERKTPRQYCSTLCRGRYRYKEDPEKFRAASRAHHWANRTLAEVVEVQAECVHCRSSFVYEAKGKLRKTYCSSACIKAAHYVANMQAYKDRASAQKLDPEYKKKCSERYFRNRDVVRLKSKAWREQNRETVRARHREYYAQNREARLAYWHKWAEDESKREAIRVNTKRWNAENPDRVRANKAVRRHLQRERVIERFDPLEVFERDGWICQLCDEPVDPDLRFPDRMSKSLDHIIPISKGGVHSRANTQLAHFSCNCSKNDKMPSELEIAA